MDNDSISRKTVLDYLKIERDKLIKGRKNEDDVIPPEARIGALLSIKAMMCFVSQLKN